MRHVHSKFPVRYFQAQERRIDLHLARLCIHNVSDCLDAPRRNAKAIQPMLLVIVMLTRGAVLPGYGCAGPQVTRKVNVPEAARLATSFPD
jgi:hypothetical protein